LQVEEDEVVAVVTEEDEVEAGETSLTWLLLELGRRSLSAMIRAPFIFNLITLVFEDPTFGHSGYPFLLVSFLGNNIGFYHGGPLVEIIKSFRLVVTKVLLSTLSPRWVA
jgi:hypothetical protein